MNENVPQFFAHAFCVKQAHQLEKLSIFLPPWNGEIRQPDERSLFGNPTGNTYEKPFGEPIGKPFDMGASGKNDEKTDCQAAA